jgi:hypothetical protein
LPDPSLARGAPAAHDTDTAAALMRAAMLRLPRWKHDDGTLPRRRRVTANDASPRNRFALLAPPPNKLGVHVHR